MPVSEFLSVDEVMRLPRESDARNAEWPQHEVLQRVFQVLARGLFDQAADIEIADVRVRPALIRSKEQLVRVDAPQQLLLAPRRIIARDGLVVVGKRAVLSDPRGVSKKLAEGEGAEATGHIEREPTFRDEREAWRGQDGLREAPPRHW